MLIVQLTGGLGNQLFQYAMGRSIALRSNTIYKTDISFFENYEWHEYSLGPFNIQAQIATKEECLAVQKTQNRFLNRLSRKLFNKGQVIIWEKSILYDPAYKKINPPAYLHGYWQSEKYFEEYADTIRNDCTITIPPSAANRIFLDQINQANAVSLHIRRGNYVAVEEFNKVIGTCSLEYYSRAIEYMKERVSNPVFYVFSDDIPWAKENLTGNYSSVFIDINDAKHDYEDLRLMQHCKHHIIANSTFSWWGAWLNSSPDKIVIAPAKWFADPEKDKTAITLVPDKWIRL